MAAQRDGGVYVVGAGLAGLRCARRLHEKGVAATVLEASDGVGGRGRPDRVDDFLLDRGFHAPSRRAWDGLRTALAPVGTLGDKLKVAALRRRVVAGSVEELFARPETTTREALAANGLSDAIVDRFFRPLFG